MDVWHRLEFKDPGNLRLTDSSETRSLPSGAYQGSTAPRPQPITDPEFWNCDCTIPLVRILYMTVVGWGCSHIVSRFVSSRSLWTEILRARIRPLWAQTFFVLTSFSNCRASPNTHRARHLSQNFELSGSEIQNFLLSYTSPAILADYIYR